MMTTLEIREWMRWPEYRLSVPKTANLTCPECGAVIECDVDLDEDAAGPREQTAAVARIETDRCEECGQLLCPKCPQVKNDGLTVCSRCSIGAAA